MKKNILFLASIGGVVSLHAADGNQSLQEMGIVRSHETERDRVLTANLVALLAETQAGINQELFLGYCPVRPLHPAASQSSLATAESSSGPLPLVEDTNGGSDISSLSSVSSRNAGSNHSTRSLFSIQDGDEDEDSHKKSSDLEVAARSVPLEADQVKAEEDSL